MYIDKEKKYFYLSNEHPYKILLIRDKFIMLSIRNLLCLRSRELLGYRYLFGMHRSKLHYRLARSEIDLG
jgi:hypothetical protein